MPYLIPASKKLYVITCLTHQIKNKKNTVLGIVLVTKNGTHISIACKRTLDPKPFGFPSDRNA